MVLVRSQIVEGVCEDVGSPSVASQLPFAFESTGFNVSKVSTCCPRCGYKLQANQLFGRFTPNGANLMALSAVGVCPVCRGGVKLQARFHSDFRVTLLARNGWQVYEVQKPPKLVMALLSWWGRKRGKPRRA